MDPIAAACVFHVYKGLEYWNNQQARFKCVSEALTKQLMSNTDPACIELACNKLRPIRSRRRCPQGTSGGMLSGRPHALRFANALVDGTIHPHQWVSLALTGTKTSESERAAQTVTSSHNDIRCSETDGTASVATGCSTSCPGDSDIGSESDSESESSFDSGSSESDAEASYAPLYHLDGGESVCDSASDSSGESDVAT